MKYFCVIFFFTYNLYAYNITSLPFEKQLREASSVIEGRLIGKNFRKHNNGDEVITEATFLVSKSVGETDRVLLNGNIIKIYFTGGSVDNFEFLPKSYPSLKVGRKYIALLNYGDYGFWPSEGGDSFYEIKKKGVSVVLNSVVSRQGSSFHDIPYKKLLEAIEAAYGHNLTKVRKESFVADRYKKRKRSRRSPASSFESRHSAEESISIVWLALIFGAMGALRLYNRSV